MSEPQTETRTCRFPGCQRPAALGDGTGRPPEYCDDPAHTRAAAWKARQRLQDGPRPPESHPVDAARQRASVITGQVTGMIEHLGQQMAVLLEELRTVGDPEAVEAQLEAMSSEAAEQVAAANARASRAEQAQRRAEAELEEADAAAAEATSETVQLSDELESLRAAHVELEEVRRGLVSELGELRGEQQRTAEALAQAGAELEEARAAVERALAERDELRVQLEAAESAQAEAESQVREAEAEADRLRSTVNDLNGQVSVLTVEVESARSEVERERAHSDQRVADIRTTYDHQLDQRLEELTRAREDAQAQRSRADRAEAQLASQTAPSRRRTSTPPATSS
ncbi:MAG: hypothetical protein ACQERF_11860 [Actinomycetota bacterium]